MTRVLGLYPVFVAVAFWMKDRHDRMNELIDSKQIKTGKFILIRFLAILTAVMIPVVLLSFESLIPLAEYSADTGIAIDTLAFIKYIIWWLLPTVTIVTALGMFLTILTSTPLSILVQFVWWFVDSATTELSGDITWHTLMIRHNMLNGSELIHQNLAVICLNRGLLVLLTILLLSRFVLHVPIAGSLLLLSFVSLLFIMVSLALGMFISTIAKSQAAAMLISGMVLMMPTMVLSGMIFPLENMPYFLQIVADFIPAKWYILAVKKIMIEGLPFAFVMKETFILLAMLVVFMTVSIKKFKSRL